MERFFASLFVTLLLIVTVGACHVWGAPQRPPRSTTPTEQRAAERTPVPYGPYVPGRPRSYAPGQDYSHCEQRPCAPKVTPAPNRNGRGQ